MVRLIYSVALSFVGLILLIILILALHRHFGTNRADFPFPVSEGVYFFRVDHEEVSTNSVQFTFESVTFRIPLNRLNQSLYQSRYDHQKIGRGGFLIEGLANDFAPRRTENIRQFYGALDEVSGVEVSVSSPCYVGEQMHNCSSVDALQKAFESELEWARKSGVVRPADQLEISGATSILGMPLYAGVEVSSATAPTIKKIEGNLQALIYAKIEKNSLIRFAICQKGGSVRHISCRIETPWRDGFTTSFWMYERLIPQYYDTHKNALVALESYIVKPSDHEELTDDIILFPPSEPMPYQSDISRFLEVFREFSVFAIAVTLGAFDKR